MTESLVNLIIREDFGETAAKIALALLQHGELHIWELVFQLRIPYLDIRPALVILIKHNIVFFTNKANPQNAEQTETAPDLIEDIVYRISMQDVLYRIRFAKILNHIGENLGKLCEDIMEQFIENGRLTVSDCVAEIDEQIKAENIDYHSETEILEAIGILVKGQYLVHVDKSNYSTELMGEPTEQTKPGLKTSGKRKAKKGLEESKKSGSRKKPKMSDGKVVNLVNDGLTAEILAKLGIAAGKDKITLGENEEVKISKGKESIKSTKDDFSKTSPIFYDSVNNQEFMFKINFRKLVHDFRMHCIYGAITNKINPISAIIIQAMLQDSQLFSRSSSFKRSEPYTLEEILEKVSRLAKLNQGSLEQYIEILETEKFVHSVPNPNRKVLLPSYSVDMEYIVEKLQMKTLEKIIEEKYSSNHSRVFRMLEKLGYLDEKQVSDTGLLPVKQARACLMELIAARMAELQDLPIEGGKTTQVYGVRPQQAIANLIEDMYKVLFNLKKRESVEIEKLNMLIETHAPEKEADKARALINKLESAALELDDTLMLFCEF